VDAINITHQYWKDPPINSVPECLSSQLKTWCIKGYRGKECEFEFAKYIMQHSRVLETTILVKKEETMSIDACLEKYQMLVNLSSCIRGSTTCKLLFD
jgi:hypothetical protein